MDDIQSLIKKFWEGSATGEEREQLLRLLDAGEGELREKMRLLYDQDIAPKKKVIHLSSPAAIVRWMAAAAIILVVALPALLRPTAHPMQVPAAETAFLPLIETVFNHGSRPMALTTCDGSRIILYPGASIRYPDPFETDKREVQLDGKARFTVARDLNRPFKVLAHGLTTTVLGTSFLVSSNPSGDSWVQLFEGSVKVRCTPQNGAAQELTLRPGQQVLLHPMAASLVLGQIPRGSQEAPGHMSAPSAGTRPRPDERLEFRQEQLSTVFNQLGKHYHTRIIYDPGEIKGKVFTGSFAADKDLGTIVRLIAALNNLKVTPQGHNLIITR